MAVTVTLEMTASEFDLVKDDFIATLAASLGVLPSAVKSLSIKPTPYTLNRALKTIITTSPCILNHDSKTLTAKSSSLDDQAKTLNAKH